MAFFVITLLLVANAMARPLSSSNTTRQMQYITLEEHCVPQALANTLTQNPLLQLLINGTFGPELVPELLDAGAGRLSDMDKNNVRIQIVSNINFDTTNAAVAHISNDGIHGNYTSAHPDRFKAFCALAMGDPLAAAAELERCVTQLGFVGGMTTANLLNGSFYDSPAYWPVFATAERLNVPIYLHPGFPPPATVLQTPGMYAPASAPGGNKTFSDVIAANLATDAWGFETGAGLSFLRLYAAGLFDQFPNLKIIFGHVGEMVPYILERSDYFLSPLTSPGKPLVQVWTENIWVTTSGYFWLDPIPTLLSNTAADRIMYSVDTPFNKNYQGRLFMEKLRRSGLVTPAEFEGIAFRNAQNLFGL